MNTPGYCYVIPILQESHINISYLDRPCLKISGSHKNMQTRTALLLFGHVVTINETEFPIVSFK